MAEGIIDVCLIAAGLGLMDNPRWWLGVIGFPIFIVGLNFMMSHVAQYEMKDIMKKSLDSIADEVEDKLRSSGENPW